MEIQKKVQGIDHPEVMKVQKDYDELLQKMHHTETSPRMVYKSRQ